MVKHQPNADHHVRRALNQASLFAVHRLAHHVAGLKDPALKLFTQVVVSLSQGVYIRTHHLAEVAVSGHLPVWFQIAHIRVDFTGQNVDLVDTQLTAVRDLRQILAGHDAHPPAGLAAAEALVRIQASAARAVCHRADDRVGHHVVRVARPAVLLREVVVYHQQAVLHIKELIAHTVGRVLKARRKLAVVERAKVSQYIARNGRFTGIALADHHHRIAGRLLHVLHHAVHRCEVGLRHLRVDDPCREGVKQQEL